MAIYSIFQGINCSLNLKNSNTRVRIESFCLPSTAPVFDKGTYTHLYGLTHWINRWEKGQGV